MDDDFTFRDVQAADRDAVLALTANTWEGGDYIHLVFDDWLADTQGRFLVVEDNSTGNIVAIDKLSFFSPTEGWFEGIRVHPDYRGRGLASRIQQYMIGEARRMGARSLRFLTSAENLAIHRNAFRDGFRARFTVRHVRWRVPAESDGQEAPQGILRRASVEEALLLYDWWRRSASHAEAGGLINRNWSFSTTSAEEWQVRAAQGQLLVPEHADLREPVLPVPLAIYSPDETFEGRAWILSLLSATGSDYAALAHALVASARLEGVERLSGVLPDSGMLLTALEEAGFEHHGYDSCLVLFETDL